MPAMQSAGVAATVERLLNLAEGESGRALRLFTLIFVMSAGLVLFKAAQGGLFLSAYPRKMIPWAFAASALTVMPFSMLAVAGATRLGPIRLAALALLFGAVGSVSLRGLLAASVPGTPFIVYVAIEVINVTVLIQTWSVVSTTLDPRSAKRILPIAGVGASVAWMLGGFVVSGLVKLIGTEGLLWVVPILFGLAAWLVRIIERKDLNAAVRTVHPMTLAQGVRNGFQFVTQVPLMRLCLFLSILALIGEQLMDYQLLATARERYAAPAAIAGFFGRFYGITSTVSLIIQLGLSSRILARLGATRSLVITPALTSFFALAVMLVPGFAPVVLLRANDRVLKGALWASALEQTQTPLPIVRRAQARTLSRGVVAPLACAIAALGMAVLPDKLDMRVLALLTMLVVLGTVAVVVTSLRHAYLSALKRAIDDRKLRLDDELIGTSVDREAAETLGRQLSDADEGRAQLAIEMLAFAPPLVAERLLLSGLGHALPTVRAAILDRLAQVGLTSIEPVGALLEREVQPEVRRAAVRCLAGSKARKELVRRTLEPYLADKDGAVRAVSRVAYVTLADPSATMRGMTLTPILKGDDPQLCLAALSALGPQSGQTPEVIVALRKLLLGDAYELRLAALHAAARIGARMLLNDIGPVLEDPRTTEAALAELVRWGKGELDRTVVAKLLSQTDRSARARAVRVLGRLVQAGRSQPLPNELVEPVLEREVIVSFGYLSLLAGVAWDDGTPDWDLAPEFVLLGGEIDLRFRDSRQRVFDLLSLIQSRKLTRVVEAGLRKANASVPNQMNAQIAELLEMALPLELARRIVPLVDKLSLRERLRAAERVELLDRAAIDDPLAFLMKLGDAHLRICAMITYGARAETRYPEAYKEDAAMIPVFERMRLLRSVPLFTEIPGEDILMVAEIVDVVECAQGEVVFRKGDPGEDMYIIMRGRVAIRDGGADIATLGEREFFGELSVLDHEARSADAVALEAAELLRLRAADFGELMARRPQIQEQILLVLARRLRALNARIAN